MNRLSKWAGMLTITGVLFTATSATASANLRAPSIRGCGDWTGAVAGIGRWLKSESDCAVFGTRGTRVGYSWAIQPGTNTRICVEALGFTGVIPAPAVRHWYPMGCGTSGHGTVPWGQRAALPTVRAKTQLGFLGGLYRWRH